MLLENKNAVIYGGGGAIGGGIARVFAREGARVVVAGRTQARLDAVAADITAAGGAAETAQVDAFDERAVTEHADAVAAKAGGIDIAVKAVTSCTTRGPRSPTSRSKSSCGRSTALGGERPGVILTLSEPGARIAVGGILGHAASSAGKEAFSRVLAAELAPSNIRVICLRPHALSDGPASGSYTKDLFKPSAASAGMPVDEWIGNLATGTLLKRLPTISVVAETAAFVASDRARAMTGTVTNLSSGLLVD
jgi:NAD(P)-dependent dehydrogenase (short-subunit alcohol dehydrogenase family)